MPSREVVAAEVTAVALVLLVLALLVLLYARRRLISRNSDVVNCGLRRHPTQRWRPALMRMTPTHLQILPVFGLTTRPVVSCDRHGLDLSPAADLEDDGGLVGVIASQVDRGACRIAVSCGPADTGTSFELALAPQAYTALRYWVESSPPRRRPL